MVVSGCQAVDGDPPAHGCPGNVRVVAMLRYDLVDVFTSRPFAGNQLAVVYGAEGLGSTQLQALAQEFALAETTFPIKPSAADRAAGADYAVRIFTASTELPFAGHPTIGTAWSLTRHGYLDAGRRVQSCRAGLVPVEIPTDVSEPLELSAAPVDLAPVPDELAGRAAESIGIAADALAGPAFVAGCGLDFLYLSVEPTALASATPRVRPMAELGLAVDTPQPIGIDAFAVSPTESGLEIASRVFVPSPTMPEDPATGSAAVGLGVALVAGRHAAADGWTRYLISQGVEMGRPSTLFGRVRAEGGLAVECRVAGQVVAIGSGEVAVPPA